MVTAMDIDRKKIPNFSMYSISKCGRLFDDFRNIELKWYITPPNRLINSKGGYRRRAMIDDSGQYRTVNRHRLMCELYNGPPSSEDKVFVNHIDGVPGNDLPENLEWVTVGQNIKHAYDMGLIVAGVRPVVHLDANGVETFYPTVNKAADKLNVPVPLIYSRVRRASGKIYSDGLSFMDVGGKWDTKSPARHPRPSGETVLIKDIFTNAITLFSNARKAALYMGESDSSVSAWFNGNRKQPLKGYWLSYTSDEIIWPVFSDYQLQIYAEYFKAKRPHAARPGILAVPVDGGNELFFTTVRAAANHFNISKSTMNNRGSRSMTVKGYKFSYVDPRNIEAWSPH